MRRTLVWNRRAGRQFFAHHRGPNLSQPEQEYLACCRRITRGLIVTHTDENDRFATAEGIETSDYPWSNKTVKTRIW